MIRKTNTMQCPNSVERKIIRNCKVFSIDLSAMMIAFLDINQASLKEMDDAHKKLETGTESVYYSIW